MTKSIKKLSKMLAIRLKCSGNKQTETELLLHFLMRMEKVLGDYSQYKTVEALFVSHIKKANKAMSKLNEEAKDMYLEELQEIAEKLHFNLKQIIG